MEPEFEEVGDLRPATVVVNVTDMERAETFWTAALGYRKPDREPEAHFSKLADLGATVVDDWTYPEEDHGFVVLRDPDGNELCVIRYES